MANVEISFAPTSDHINQIMIWMTHDQKSSKDGLVHNWNYILEGFSQNRAAVALLDFCAVGFAVWKPQETDTYSIDYLQIKSDARKYGLGKTLVARVEEMLVANGGLMIMGNSISKNSDAFWLKMGNKRLPQSIIDKNVACRDDSFMFKILVNALPPNMGANSNETIELWEKEDYQITADQQADYTWSLVFEPNTRMISKPIIIPADGEWMIKWSINGRQHKYTRVKKFPSNESKSCFLIIRTLFH